MASFFVTDARREGRPFLSAVAVVAALGGFLFGLEDIQRDVTGESRRRRRHGQLRSA